MNSLIPDGPCPQHVTDLVEGNVIKGEVFLAQRRLRKAIDQEGISAQRLDKVVFGLFGGGWRERLYPSLKTKILASQIMATAPCRETATLLS